MVNHAHLVNQMEPVVKTVVDEVFSKNTAICFCERCKMDIMALALNTLPPRYVVTHLGEIVTKVDLDSCQWKADVMIAVFRAIELVKNKPRH